MDKIEKHFDLIYAEINDSKLTRIKRLKLLLSLEEVKLKIQRKYDKIDKEDINRNFMYL